MQVTLGTQFGWQIAAAEVTTGAWLITVVLCAVAGIGTFFLLPSRREKSLRTIGGVIVLVAGLVAAALLVRAAALQTSGDVYFWVFGFIAVGSALRVISHPNPVYAALYFVLTVLASAGLFVLLWADFMAAALVLIYAGAILVTYVFVIMLAHQAHSAAAGDVGGAECDIHSREPLAACALGFTLMAVLLTVILNPLNQLPASAAASAAPTVKDLGRYLFAEQVVNLELAGVILTLAMVGAVVIARRRVPTVAQVVPEEVTVKDTPPDDNPHSIPIEGTRNPAAKAYPET
jgi:NADH-quinone oxidoreductase subunit J